VPIAAVVRIHLRTAGGVRFDTPVYRHVPAAIDEAVHLVAALGATVD
jgi:hypothetical protein